MLFLNIILLDSKSFINEHLKNRILMTTNIYIYMFYNTVFAIGIRSYTFALLISIISHYQHLFWGMTFWSSLFYEHFIFIKWWLPPVRPYPHSAKLEVIFLKRAALLEQTQQELTSHIKSFWKRPGIGSGADIIQMQMSFISGLLWMPNFGAKGLTTDHLLFSTTKQNINKRTNIVVSNQCPKRLIKAL